MNGRVLEWSEPDVKGWITPSRTLMATSSSSMWVETCAMSPGFPFAYLTLPFRCVARKSEGGVTIVTAKVPEGTDCSGPPRIDVSVSLRKGQVIGWTVETTDQFGSTDEYQVSRSELRGEPPPWRVVPKWFVDLID